MIVRDVIPDQTAQMNVIEDDEVIEKLSATAPDPAFRDSILPRACRAYTCGSHAAACEQLDYLLAKLAVTIKNRIAVRTVSGNASLSCWTIQGPVGCSVTLKWRTLRRPCSMTKKQYKTRKVRVGTVKKSMAVMSSRWLQRKADHSLRASLGGDRRRR